METFFLSYLLNNQAKEIEYRQTNTLVVQIQNINIAQKIILSGM